MTNVIIFMWVRNDCSFLSDSQYETMQNTNCTWICPKCDFFNFSDSFFDEQLNLESENRLRLIPGIFIGISIVRGKIPKAFPL